VLERVHGARIDIDVGVELLEGHGKAAAFEESADGCCCQTFAERGENTACDEYELGPGGGL
jgi:hypothetical protein